MLKKGHRLLKKEDFSALFAGGRHIRGNFISLKILKNGLAYARVGFVVGGKVAKKSTVRNLIKRRLRAIVHAFEDEIRGGVDVAVLPSAEIMHKNFKNIEKETRGVFEKARLLQNVRPWNL
ncbi:MAG: ribonuclease P protein component [Candidatus Spechtbacteria bacterium]|nr:ribonuclease P protein component [Candidatus Spechtbacteria bacterium]